MTTREACRQLAEGLLMGAMIIFAAIGIVRVTVALWGLA